MWRVLAAPTTDGAWTEDGQRADELNAAHPAAICRQQPRVVARLSALAAYQTDESLLFANLAPPGPGIQSGAQLAGYARIWLVLSHVDTRTAGTAVPPWLAQHYRLVRQQHFVGVTVQLYHASAA